MLYSLAFSPVPKILAKEAFSTYSDHRLASSPCWPYLIVTEQCIFPLSRLCKHCTCMRLANAWTQISTISQEYILHCIYMHALDPV